MGPVMNLALALVLTAVVLYQGVEGAALRRSAAGRRRGRRRTRSPRARTSSPAIASSRWPSAPVDTWEQFLIAVGTKPDREVAIGLLRNGLEQTRKVTPAVRPPEPLRDRRHRRAAERASARPVGARRRAPPIRPGSRPATSSSRSTAQPITFSYQLREAIAKHPEQPITLTILRDGTPQTIPATPARHGNDGLPRHRHRRRDREDQAGARPGDHAERARRTSNTRA